MAENKDLTPEEAGRELYYLLKYGQPSKSKPVRRTETRRITRMLPNGQIEILEHEITVEGYED